MKTTLLSLALVVCLSAGANAQLALTQGTYTQNFNGIGTDLPTGFTVRTGATATALGTAETFTTAQDTWGNTSGNFRNVASATGMISTATTAQQNTTTNRALGVRPSGSFGDPGASFNFNFSTINLNVTSISIDLMMLSVQPRSTTWSIQYGVGAAPASYVTLGTYTDPGTFGTTNRSFTATNFGTALNNRSNLQFRVVALSASTNSGNRDTFAIDNLVITAVPEPHEYALGIGALVVLVAFARRRRLAA